MPDRSYSEAHSATSAALIRLGYLANDDFERRIFVDMLLSIAVGGGRFVHNRKKAASRKQVEKEISEINKAAWRLSSLLNGLHGTTCSKLKGVGLNINTLDANCSQITAACNYLIDTSDIPLKLPKSKTRDSEQKIAEELAGLFTRSTGRRASLTYDPYKQVTSGDFLSLVLAVFEALGIEASAGSCVDHVRKRRSL